MYAVLVVVCSECSVNRMWYNEILARKTLSRLDRSGNNGIFQECQYARIVFHQGSSLIMVVFHQVGPMSGLYFNPVVPHQGGISSGWSLVKVVFHQVVPSSGWYFIRVVPRQGSISSGWVPRQGIISSF